MGHRAGVGLSTGEHRSLRPRLCGNGTNFPGKREFQTNTRQFSDEESGPGSDLLKRLKRFTMLEQTTDFDVLP